MKIHCLQHAPFEGLGRIEDWISNRGHHLTMTRLFLQESLPKLDSFDWLIIMGGPMNIYDDGRYPWLRAEREFLCKALHAGKTALGVCLGAQLLADALGARVYPNPVKEIGWFPVGFRDADGIRRFFPGAPATLEVFHWHGDTFDLPPGAQWLAGSRHCPHQAFVWNNRVVGLQFHLEMTTSGLEALIDNCRGELVTGQAIQSEAEMRATSGHWKPMHSVLHRLLDALEEVS